MHQTFRSSVSCDQAEDALASACPNLCTQTHTKQSKKVVFLLGQYYRYEQRRGGLLNLCEAAVLLYNDTDMQTYLLAYHPKEAAETPHVGESVSGVVCFLLAQSVTAGFLPEACENAITH